MKKITQNDMTDRVRECIIESAWFYERTQNKSFPIPLSETDAQKLVERHSVGGYIIISADFGGCDIASDTNAQEEKKRTRDTNNRQTEALFGDIQNNGFSYTPCYGVFIEDKGTENEEAAYEQGFIVYSNKRNGESDFGLLKQFALEMCGKYNQDFVLIDAPDESPAYYNRDGEICCRFNDGMSINDVAKKYFIDLHSNNQNKKNARSLPKFSFIETYISPKPQCYSEGHVRFLKGEIFIKR